MGKGGGLGEGKGAGKGSGGGDGAGEDYKGKTERLAVPAMPAPAAVVCCVLNFLIPGFGTVCAGFSSFCCSRNEDMSGGERFASCCVSFGIGLLQLLTTVLCFIGWIWSCVWGGFFIVSSAEYYHNNKVDVDEQRQRALAQSTGVVIIAQPGTHVQNVIRQPIGTYGNPNMPQTQYVSQNYNTPLSYNQMGSTQVQVVTSNPGAPSDKQLYPPSYNQ